MRFTSVWTTAKIEPTASVRTAITYMAGRQSTLSAPNVTTNTRSRAANPAAFAADAMNPVTGVGEPWYTSGVQKWNGAAATLKANPNSKSARPATKSALL